MYELCIQQKDISGLWPWMVLLLVRRCLLCYLPWDKLRNLRSKSSCAVSSSYHELGKPRKLPRSLSSHFCIFLLFSGLYVQNSHSQYHRANLSSNQIFNGPLNNRQCSQTHILLGHLMANPESSYTTNVIHQHNCEFHMTTTTKDTTEQKRSINTMTAWIHHKHAGVYC